MPTRTMTVSDSNCSTITVPLNSGPTHALTSGVAISISAPPMGITVASDSFVPCSRIA